MNIVVSTHDLLKPIRGGGALRTIKIALEFKKMGHNVIIIAPTDGFCEVEGIKTHWLHPPRKQRSQILSSLKFNIRLLRKFLQFVSNADMFFVHNTIAAATLPFLKYFFNFKFALDITDIHAEYLKVNRKNIIEKIFTPLILAIEYWIIKSADVLIVVTMAMKELVFKKGIPEKKVHVIYDAADINNITFEKEKDFRQGVIHLGTVDRQHNVEVFIKAIPEIIKVKPDVKFYIVGGGRELDNIIKLAKDLKVYEKCIFTNYLPCEEARKYLSKAFIGIISRNDNLPNRIVTTLKLYEYWASKTAVISSNTTGICEISNEGEDIVFFEAGNSESLAEKIIYLIQNPDKSDRIRENGYKTVQKFTWDIIALQMASVCLRD